MDQLSRSVVCSWWLELNRTRIYSTRQKANWKEDGRNMMLSGWKYSNMDWCWRQTTSLSQESIRRATTMSTRDTVWGLAMSAAIRRICHLRNVDRTKGRCESDFATSSICKDLATTMNETNRLGLSELSITRVWDIYSKTQAMDKRITPLDEPCQEYHTRLPPGTCFFSATKEGTSYSLSSSPISFA